MDNRIVFVFAIYFFFGRKTRERETLQIKLIWLNGSWARERERERERIGKWINVADSCVYGAHRLTNCFFEFGKFERTKKNTAKLIPEFQFFLEKRKKSREKIKLENENSSVHHTWNKTNKQKIECLNWRMVKR